MAIKITQLDVRKFGAKGDGTTDDSQAFIKMRDYAISQMVIGFNSSGNPVGRYVFYIPAGTYLITQPGALLNSTNRAPQGFSAQGLQWKGDGRAFTNIVYKPVCDPTVGAETFLLYDNDTFMHINFSDMTFSTEQPLVNRRVSSITVTNPCTASGNGTLIVNGNPFVIPLTTVTHTTPASVATAIGFAEPYGVKVHVSNATITFDELASNSPTTLSWDATGAIPEVLQLQVTAPCASSGNLNVTLNSVLFPVGVVSGDNMNTVAHKIRTTAMTGWILGGSGVVVTFTSTTTGVKAAHIATSNNGTGATTVGSIVLLGAASGTNTGATATISGIANPTAAPTFSQATNAGSTLPAANYYGVYTWSNATGETLVSAEAGPFALSASNNLIMTVPSLPAGATLAGCYIGTAPGNATKQGTTATTTFTQSSNLVAGASKPIFNTSQAPVTAIAQLVNSCMYFYGSNCAQNFTWERCEFGGGWKTVYQLEGNNIDSECSWTHCGIGTAVETGLLIGPNANAQFVNYNLYDCQFTVAEGDYINAAQGGSINIWGGSIMHFGPTNPGGTMFTLGNSFTQYSLIVSSGCTVNGNATLTLDNVNYNLALTTTENTADKVAAKILASMTFPGWTILQGHDPNMVTFIRETPKTNKYFITYNAGATGVTATVAESTGATLQVAQSTSGGGTGASKFHCQGVRFENPTPKSRLVDCYWSIGEVSFKGCDNSSQSFQSYTHGLSATFNLGGNSGPVIAWHNCTLTGQHKYTYSSTTWRNEPRISYVDCEFWSAYDPSGFILLDNKDKFIGAIQDGGRPIINFDRCRSAQAGNSLIQYKYLWDSSFGWSASNRGTTRRRVVQIQNANNQFPQGTNTEDVFLPLNAVITKATINIAAGATISTTSGWHYYLGTYLETTLNGPITNIATSITLVVNSLPVNSVDYFSTLTVPFNLIIGTEQLTVTAYNAITGVATVTRGVSGTTAASALTGAKVTTVPVILLDAIPVSGDNPSLGFNSTVDLFSPCSTQVKRRVVLYSSSAVNANPNPVGYALIEYLA